MKKTLFILAVLVLLCTACQKQEPAISVEIGPDDVIDESGTAAVEETPAEEMPLEEAEETPSEEAETTDETSDETPAETDETETSDHELGEVKCDEKQTIGYVGCIDMNSYAELSLKNAGRMDLTGLYIRYLDSDDNILEQETDLFEFPVGDGKILNLSIIEHLEQINVYPITNGDICINKPTVLIPTTNCR